MSWFGEGRGSYLCKRVGSYHSGLHSIGSGVACCVKCWCGNAVIVVVLHSRSSKDAGVMHLLKCLVFVEAVLGC